MRHGAWSNVVSRVGKVVEAGPTCYRCGCRYTVVEVDPTVIGLAHDEYVMRLHEQVASLRRG